MATLKQKKWLKEYVKTGNATEAAQRAYDVKDRKSAGQIGHENLEKLKKPISELCDELGLTDELIISALKEDIETKKQNRKAELELAMKVKGKLTEKQEVTGDLTFKIVRGEDENNQHILPDQATR